MGIADIIEEFILRKLSDEQSDVIMLRRNEIAEEMACAPSQISYVLSTRFTLERGFLVESRRGLGGFVRIVRVPVQKAIYEDAARNIDEKTSLYDLMNVIEHLRVHGLTMREAALLRNVGVIIYDRAEPEERAQILRSLLITLADFS